MDDIPSVADQAMLRFLRRLVMVLTITMTAGFLVLIALLVTWFPALRTPMPAPDSITLPDGVTATAFTLGPDWYAVVSDRDEILIFDRASGALDRRVVIKR